MMFITTVNNMMSGKNKEHKALLATSFLIKPIYAGLTEYVPSSFLKITIILNSC